MYTSRYDEFPHTVELIERGALRDSYEGGKQYDWKSVGVFKGFMDTPTPNEQLRFHQMDLQVDRAMYTRYSIPLDRINRIRYDGVIYEIVGEPSDQGGMKEINRTMLRKLPNG